jgi:hypothetical protein
MASVSFALFGVGTDQPATQLTRLLKCGDFGCLSAIDALVAMGSGAKAAILFLLLLAKSTEPLHQRGVTVAPRRTDPVAATKAGVR